ncbi:MAG: lipid-A-disaccharide synthase [Bacteroidales bacterium]|nr:lipid-A-disaccharide synthase [Bacteroidales bacterium]
MKYYIIAGEASGDLHAANLMKHIKSHDPEARFRFWGGDKMQAQGQELVKHYRDLAFMGFSEVVMNLRTILRNIRFCKDDIVRYEPDVIILVDYPGFNLRIAEFAHNSGYRVFYYISPQVWAWKQSRVKKIKKYVERMFVILPFEQEFYAKHNFPVDFVGHPLLDAIEEDIHPPDREEFLKKNDLPEKPIVALLPGSRKQEIAGMLAVMLEVADRFSGYQFVIAGMSSIPKAFYDKITKEHGIKIIIDQTYALLSHAEAALVTSGTATLETALMEVPEVVCYRGSGVSYQIAKRLVKVDYISLVNLIMKREIIKELIQNEFTSDNLAHELDKILHNGQIRNKMLDDYKLLKKKLGGKGASEHAARLMVEYLNENSKTAKYET